MKERRLSPGGVIMLFMPVVFIYLFSTWPSYEFYAPNESQLLISLKKRTEKTHICDEKEREAFMEEIASKPKHMQVVHRECGSRDRVPLELKIWLDGVESLSKVIKPAGIRSDGVVFVYEKFTFKSGPHDIRITMRDFKDNPKIKVHEFKEHLDFQPRKVTLVSYTPETDALLIHK
ncbi:MAG: hypothetical protein OEZ32_01780 [Nitrospinota bacterium]|nr:hypothetical protein [Nitrospinota bacterium]